MRKAEEFYGVEVRKKIRGLTGRRPKTEVHIKVVKERCNGCGNCVRFCPSGSYQLEDGYATWKYGMKLCLECGTCYQVCESEAIEWRYPRRGEGVIYKSG
jgi:ferredoxin-like protein FixX